MRGNVTHVVKIGLQHATPTILTVALIILLPQLAAAKTIQLSPGVTIPQFTAALSDDTNDIIELTPGTYRFDGEIYVTANRTRTVVVRPVQGTEVVFTEVISLDSLFSKVEQAISLSTELSSMDIA